MKNMIQRGANIKVLMYHRVLTEMPANPVEWHWVTVDTFSKHLKIIDSLGFTPITFRDYYLALQEKLTLPGKPIILTFDDGYRDTYHNALQILLKFNMTAVIFAMGNRQILEAGWDSSGEQDNCLLMNNDELREARALGFEIGAHSMNHLNLSTLEPETVRKEIGDSKRELEKVLGERVLSFAYPYGGLNDSVQKMTEKSGFLFGCGVYTGPPKFMVNRYDIRRLAVNSKTGITNFILKLLTPYEYAEWLYNKSQKLGYELKNMNSSKGNYDMGKDFEKLIKR